MFEKMPRHYAAEIMKAETREERVRLLGLVPFQYEEWVEDIVRSAFAIRAKTPPHIKAKILRKQEEQQTKKRK